MVFKRRDKQTWTAYLMGMLWPRGGWGRAALYLKHRLNRLPDNPEKIARGVWAGVFTTFTPFYGFHFIIAAAIATVLRGNILAALLATFFGNPLTYIPIGVVSLKTGGFLLGLENAEEDASSFAVLLWRAFHDLLSNIGALFTGKSTDWTHLIEFYNNVFLPYMFGGIFPGVITATICWYISLPIIRAYQNRRRGKLRDKLLALKKKRAKSEQ